MLTSPLRAYRVSGGIRGSARARAGPTGLHLSLPRRPGLPQGGGPGADRPWIRRGAPRRGPGRPAARRRRAWRGSRARSAIAPEAARIGEERDAPRRRGAPAVSSAPAGAPRRRRRPGRARSPSARPPARPASGTRIDGRPRAASSVTVPAPGAARPRGSRRRRDRRAPRRRAPRTRYRARSGGGSRAACSREPRQVPLRVVAALVDDLGQRRGAARARPRRRGSPDGRRARRP